MRPEDNDNSIDRTLAALRSAAPPEGMEVRIAQRLAADRVSHSSRLGGMGGFIASLMPQSAWLRGALTGAAVATAACAALVFLTRIPHAPLTADHPTAPAKQNVPAATNVSLNTSPPGAPSKLCLGGDVNASTLRVPHSSRSIPRDEWEGRVPHPGSAWVGSPGTTARRPHLIPASFAPSKPAPPAPLTAQERALVQLVRTATPAELAQLNPAAQQKADADREAAFQKFFAPSPELLAADKAQQEALDAGKTTTQQPAEVQN